jgi:hypothetical protein
MLSPLKWATILTIVLLQSQLKFWPGTQLELDEVQFLNYLVNLAIRFSITYLMNMYILIYWNNFQSFSFFILSWILSISTVYLFNCRAGHQKANSMIPLQQLTHSWAEAAHRSQSISFTLLYRPTSKKQALDSETVLPDTW